MSSHTEEFSRDSNVHPQHIVDVHVESPLEFADVEPLKHAVLMTLAQQAVQGACEVVVVISDDAALQDLNRRFRGVNRPTDVLAFSNDTRGPFAAGGLDWSSPRYLGDIVISLPRAQEQAQYAGGTLVQELQLLAVHGTLHLLGHDHADPAQKAQMWTAQALILQSLGVDIPLPE